MPAMKYRVDRRHVPPQPPTQESDRKLPAQPTATTGATAGTATLVKNFESKERAKAAAAGRRPPPEAEELDRRIAGKVAASGARSVRGIAGRVAALTSSLEGQGRPPSSSNLDEKIAAKNASASAARASSLRTLDEKIAAKNAAASVAAGAGGTAAPASAADGQIAAKNAAVAGRDAAHPAPLTPVSDVDRKIEAKVAASGTAPRTPPRTPPPIPPPPPPPLLVGLKVGNDGVGTAAAARPGVVSVAALATAKGGRAAAATAAAPGGNGTLPAAPPTPSTLASEVERSAIESLVERQEGYVLKSPATGKPMGTRLLPADSVRRTIEQLVNGGVLGGDEARRWMARGDGEKYVAWLRKTAEEGDAKSMCDLALLFERGERGFERDDKEAYQWYRMAADQQYPPAMAKAGDMLVLGEGVRKNVAEGLVLTSAAASLNGGSDYAAFLLGEWYAEGRYGLPQNKDWAKHWLKMAVDGDCAFINLGNKAKIRARSLLEK